MLRKVLLLGLCVSWGLLAVVAGVGAQGIRVTPARIEAVLRDDGVLPSVFIHNRSSEPVVIRAETGWGTHDLYGSPIYLDHDARPGPQLYVEPREAFLSPGATLRISLRIDSTDQASYPMLFLQLHRPRAPEAEKTRIAVPILLHTGREERRARVEGIRLDSDGHGRALVQAVVVNEGKAHIRTAGTVRLLRPDDTLAMELELPELIVLPGARRLVTASWPAEALDLGEYRLVLETTDPMEWVAPIRFAVRPDGLYELGPEGAEQLAKGAPWL